MLSQLIQNIQKKYSNRSYEHRGRVKTMLYMNLFLFPSFFIILVGMNVIASRSLFDPFNVVVTGFTVIVIIGMFLINYGYYNAAVNIFVFAVSLGLIFNSYGTALKGAPDRLVASFLPWIVAVFYATFFCTVRVLAAVVAIQVVGYILMIYSVALISPEMKGIVFFDSLIALFLSLLISYLGVRINRVARDLRREETDA